MPTFLDMIPICALRYVCRSPVPILVISTTNASMATLCFTADRILRLSFVVLIASSTMLFGIGSYPILWALGAAIVAALGIRVADVTGRFRLPRQWANLLAAVTVGIWLLSGPVYGDQLQMGNVAYVLMILQAVLVFQEKTQPIYWQLLVLSIAQTAVASALSPDLLSCVVMFGFVYGGVWALALLLMKRELRRFTTVPTAVTCDTAADGSLGPDSTRSGKRASLYFVGSASEFDESSWLRALGRQITVIATWILVIASFLFLLVPRIDYSVARSSELDEHGQRTVGFNEDITIGDEFGESFQNSDVVMRFQLFDEPSGESVRLLKDPLVRGCVATHYVDGKWREPRAVHPRPLSVNRARHFVRQRITVEPLDQLSLFAIAPVSEITRDERLWLDQKDSRMLRARSLRGERVAYEVATTGIRDRRQLPIVPATASEGVDTAQLLQMPAATTGGADPLAGLRTLATRLRAESKLSDGDRLGVARAFESFLRDSGEFHYTLQAQNRDSDRDPAEDFVTGGRSGHCEFFAGAIALTLRSQGIPARVVTGFRAAEWNSAGDYYEVRQLHAHAWVEAYLRPEQCTVTSDQPSADLPDGGWLTLDATPGGGDQNDSERDRGFIRRAWMYFDYMKSLWGGYVTGMNAESQQVMIYEPLKQFVGGLFQELWNLDRWNERLVAAQSAVFSGTGSESSRSWFSTAGASTTLFVLMVGLVIYRGGAWVVTSIGVIEQKPSSRRRAGSVSQSVIYRRLEQLFKRRGFVRDAGQTPLEFAMSMSGELATHLDVAQLAAFPKLVVDAFYRMRFGGRSLDASELSAVESALRELDKAL